MSIGQLDVAIRLGAITVILLLAWLLFRQRQEVGAPALLFPPLALSLSGFLIGNTPAPLRLSGLSGIAHFFSGCTVVFLWWFCLSCFDRRFRLSGGTLAIGLVWIGLASLDRGLMGATVADKAAPHVMVALGFGIVGHLIWRLVAERQDDLVEHRHDARLMVAILLGGQLLVDLSVDLFLGFEWRPLGFAMTQNAAILCFGLWLSGKVIAVRSDVLTFGEFPRSALHPIHCPIETEDRALDNVLRSRLSTLIEAQRVYLDPDLTFGKFVEQMGEPERVVRRLVNHELGFDHFRSFLNHYRMIEARRLLADPRRSKDKLIAIALDSGFASLPSFNRVFRTFESCTPSRYRKMALAASKRSQGDEKPEKSSGLSPFEKRSATF